MRVVCVVAAFGIVFPLASQNVEEFAETVIEIAQQELTQWIDDPFLVYAIEEQNERHASMTAAEIERLDVRWVREGRRGAMSADLLDRQASILLRERRERADGIITEIIVMDRFGLNAAISDPTSDYYQGDEAKYQETYPLGAGAIFVDEVEFDESTGKWQTQVSLTVVSAESGEPIGAVTFGIDLTQLE